MTTLSTHVLDAALGRPAAGLPVTLRRPGAPDLDPVPTDDDGRVRFAVDLGPGTHVLSFATGPWFAAADRPALYPVVEISVDVDDGEPHYHVALLLSPFSYTTYRGS